MTVWAECYRNGMGKGRAKLPLRTRDDPIDNSVERRSWRQFDSRLAAQKTALQQEHKKYGHDRPRDDCPLCDQGEQ